MADNVTSPVADGTTFAFDEATIGGTAVKIPRTKLGFGADGSYTEVEASAPLPVTIGAGPFAVTGSFYPATQPVSGTVSVSGSVAVTGPLTDTQLRASALPISAASLPLPAGAATQATLAAVLTEATFTTRIPTNGDKAASGSVPVALSKDQDPIFDHANAVKATVTGAASTVITPPAGARYLRVHATADMFIRTDGTAAADAAGSILIKAGVPENIPVTGGTGVSAFVTTGSATLYATPSKSR